MEVRECKLDAAMLQFLTYNLYSDIILLVIRPLTPRRNPVKVSPNVRRAGRYTLAFAWLYAQAWWVILLIALIITGVKVVSGTYTDTMNPAEATVFLCWTLVFASSAVLRLGLHLFWGYTVTREWCKAERKTRLSFSRTSTSHDIWSGNTYYPWDHVCIHCGEQDGGIGGSLGG